VRIAAASALGEIRHYGAARDLAHLYTEAVRTHDDSVTRHLVRIVAALDKLGWKPGPGGWGPAR
jgi:hypothetical protein